MADYMNYGVIGNTGIPPRVPVDTTHYTQVYMATHNGSYPLPYMYRSFISFSYGGKNIEDFNLIATFNDRLDKDGYASFNDLVSTYDVLHGQTFWGSYYQANQLSFTLSTDAIDQLELDEFLRWFQAGVTRELILAEHPNRAIMARVSSPPHLSLIPFEKPVRIQLNQQYYNTSTTVYKGSITLNFVMDEPHWYGKLNIFGKKDSAGIYHDSWFDVSTGRERHVLDIPDALKILYEDGIPLSSMITSTMLLGGSTYAIVENKVNSRIVAAINEAEYNEHQGEEGYYYSAIGYTQNDEQIHYFRGAVIFNPNTNKGGRIAGASMGENNGISFIPPYGTSPDSTTYFYYAGTAPSPTKLTFTLVPTLENWYINNPKNKYTAEENDAPYNTITIESTNKREFKFTTPNILTSYNQVITIFDTPSIMQEGQGWAYIRELIRETVNHAGVRAWANRVIDYIDTHEGIIQDGQSYDAKEKMSYLFTTTRGGALFPMTFTFNSQTGEAVGTIKYRHCIDQATGELIDLDKDDELINYCKQNIIEEKENVGDMVKSPYLIIEERNYPNASGNIVPWMEGTNQSHRLYHDVENGLRNVFLEYKNMYL